MSSGVVDIVAVDDVHREGAVIFLVVDVHPFRMRTSIISALGGSVKSSAPRVAKRTPLLVRNSKARRFSS